MQFFYEISKLFINNKRLDHCSVFVESFHKIIYSDTLFVIFSTYNLIYLERKQVVIKFLLLLKSFIYTINEYIFQTIFAEHQVIDIESITINIIRFIFHINLITNDALYFLKPETKCLNILICLAKLIFTFFSNFLHYGKIFSFTNA
jgi:hypothetical protein